MRIKRSFFRSKTEQRNKILTSRKSRQAVLSSHSTLKNPDYPLIFLTLSLIVFGVIMVYNSSVVNSSLDIGDKYYFLKNQLFSAFLGLIALVVTAKIDYHFWSRVAFLSLIISTALLLAVFIPGLGVKIYGAHRWLSLGFITLQPAEIMKMSLILYLSTVFTKRVALAN